MSKFIDSQKILLNILTFLGFFSFDFCNYKRTNRRWIYCYLFNLVVNIHFVFVTLHYLKTYVAFLHDESNVTQIIHFIESITNLVTKIIIVLSSLFRYDRQIDILKSLEWIEGKIYGLKFEDLTKFFEHLRLKSKIFIICSAIFHIILQIMYTQILMKDEPLLHKITSVTYIFFSFHFTMVSFFIYFQLLTIKKFCEILRKNLAYFVMQSSFHEKKIDEIYEIIFNIKDLFISWNYFNGLILFGCFVFIFGVLSAELYFSFVTFFFSSLAVLEPIYHFYNFCNLIW